MKALGTAIILTALIVVVTGSGGCILEPDTEFLPGDTVIVQDTVSLHDTATVRDTTTLHDTLRIHDTTYIYRDTLRMHDTVEVHDTTTKYDTVTVHDTTEVHDTVEVHDTLRTFAASTVVDDVYGVWEGIVKGETVRLAISSHSYNAFSFTANVGSTAHDGYADSFSNNMASMVIDGFRDATWSLSVENNTLTVQESGYAVFPTMEAFELERIL